VATIEERIWGCQVHERRGLDSALAAVTGWGQRWYSQDKRAIAAATRAVELARQALDPPPHPHVRRTGPPLRRGGRLQPSAREVSTARKVGAVAVGAGAIVGVGVGIWMLSR
jgi:hypothetical protein